VSQAHPGVQGTYYGDNGGAGACSFSVSNSQYLPWAAGTSKCAL